MMREIESHPLVMSGERVNSGIEALSKDVRSSFSGRLRWRRPHRRNIFVQGSCVVRNSLTCCRELHGSRVGITQGVLGRR